VAAYHNSACQKEREEFLHLLDRVELITIQQLSAQVRNSWERSITTKVAKLP